MTSGRFSLQIDDDWQPVPLDYFEEYGFQPGLVWSLLDMQRITASDITAITGEIAAIADSWKKNPQGLGPGDTAWMHNHLKRISEHMTTLHMSNAIIEDAIKDPPATEREFKKYEKAVLTELGERCFVYLPKQDASYLINPPFTKAVKAAFPRVDGEMKLAGQCIALELYTASVLHCARAMEIGLRSLTAALECEFKDDEKPLEKAQIGTLLKKCEAAIAEKRRGPYYRGRDEELEFFDSAKTHFAAFKDAERVRSAHVGVTFTRAEAVTILLSVRGYFNKIHGKLKEPPIPSEGT